MEEQQNLLFEFKDYQARGRDLDGHVVQDSPLPADDGSMLTNIGNTVANHGGSSAITRSRSRNSSSIRIGGSPDNMRVKSKQLGHSEFQSMTSALHTLLASFVTAGAATAFLKESGGMMDHWLRAGAGRSITFKHKGNTVSLKGRDDLEKLISHLQRM